MHSNLSKETFDSIETNVLRKLLEAFENYMEANQLSQEGAAYDLGLSFVTVRRLKHWDLDPKLSTLLELCAALGYEPEITLNKISKEPLISEN